VLTCQQRQDTALRQLDRKYPCLVLLRVGPSGVRFVVSRDQSGDVAVAPWQAEKLEGISCKSLQQAKTAPNCRRKAYRFCDYDAGDLRRVPSVLPRWSVGVG